MITAPCPPRDQLERLLAGGLGDAEDAALSQHLERCNPCQQALERLTAGASSIGSRLRPADEPDPNGAWIDRLKHDSFPRPAPAPQRFVNPCLPDVSGYEVLSEIGRGGMGVIYKARRHGLSREVALKMVLGGDRADAHALARFRTEAEAVARLQHPNIVQIYDVGESDGRPYLAMEYVAGGSLKQHLDGRPQPPRQAAALVETLARAADAAHRAGVVHRDLKPANVLIQRTEDRGQRTGDPESSLSSVFCPLSSGSPKVTDFGLAKLLTGDSSPDGATRTGDILGTPSYMAPEQAQGRGPAIGPAADVYALGAILYELLTGRPPFRAETAFDTLVQLLHEEPVSVSRLVPAAPRDLVTVAHKCLEKDPARRYASAAALADDLERYRTGQPILARPAGAVERFAKWARRHPGVAALSATLVLVMIAGLALVTWLWRDAVAVAEAEAKARHEAERLVLGNDIDKAVTLCERGDMSRGLLHLVHCLTTAARLNEPDLERVARINLDGWRNSLIVEKGFLRHGEWVWDVAYSPDGHTILTGSRDTTARLWDAATGAPAGPPLKHPHPVWAVAFSPDGKTLLTGCGDDDRSPGDVRFWDAATGQLVGAPLESAGRVTVLAVSRDGRRVLAVGGGKARLGTISPRSLTGGKMVPDSLPIELAHPGEVRAAGFSPDGRLVVTAGPDGTARLWNAEDGQPHGEPLPHDGPVTAVAFQADGRVLAAGNSILEEATRRAMGGEVRLWDVATGEPVGRVMPHPGPIRCLTFSPDGRLLLSAANVVPLEPAVPLRGAVRLWDAASGEPVGEPVVHPEPVWSAAFSPDGRLFATGCQDGNVRLCLTATGAFAAQHLVRDHNGTVRALAFAQDGRTLTATHAGDARLAQLLEMPRGRADSRAIRGVAEPNFVALSSDGRLLVTGRKEGGTPRIWNVAERRPLAAQPPTMKCYAAAFAPDHQTLVLGTADGVEFWDVVAGRPAATPLTDVPRPVEHLLVSPDGKWVLVGSGPSGGYQIWNLAERQPVSEMLPFSDVAGGVALAPDGGRLVLVGRSLRLHEAPSGRLLGRVQSDEPWLWAVAFSPDGRTFATGGRRRSVLIRDAATGRAVGPPFPHPGEVTAIAFSADGRMLLTGGRDGTARLWDVPTGKPLGPPLAHRGDVWAVAFLPGGQSVVTSGADGAVPIWDVPTPLPGDAQSVRREIESLTGLVLEADGSIHERDRETAGLRAPAL